MNKSTLILLGVLVVLGGVTWFVTRPEPPPEERSFIVAGYATDAQLEAEKKRDLTAPAEPIEYPVDEIIVERQGKKLHLKRTGEGKELAWELVEPVKAPAVKWAVEKMITPFKTESSSIYSKDISGDNPREYDLEEERRIKVTLMAGGSVWNGVDIIIGGVQKSDAQAGPQGQPAEDKDTWLVAAADDKVIYRIGGKDLRTPFEQELSDLRDKALFSAKPDDLVKVTIEPPEGPKVVLQGTRTETPAAEEGKPPKVEVSWALAEPAGFEADASAKSFTRNLANARTKKFVPKGEAPENPLGDAVWRVSGETHEGKAFAIKLGAPVAGEEDMFWAQVEGADEFLQLDKWGARNLRKGLEDLRDKRALGSALTPESLTRVQFAPEGGEPVVIAKEGEAWRFVQPKLEASVDAESTLKQVVELKVARFARKSDEEAAAAALKDPEFTSELAAGDKVWRIVVGKKIEEEDDKNHRWAAAYEGEAETPKEIFLLQDHMAKRLRKSADDLRNKKVFTFDKANIARMSVKWPDGETELVLEKSPEGELTPVGLPEGKAPKKSVVTTMATTLTALRVKGFEDGKKPAEVGLTPDKAYVVTAALDDGTTYTLLISKEKSGSDPYGTADAGPLANQVFTLNNYQALNLQKKIEDLQE